MATVGVKGLSKHVKSKYHTDGLKPTLQLDDISLIEPYKTDHVSVIVVCYDCTDVLDGILFTG